MTDHTKLYNSLPSLKEAHSSFRNRREIFEKVSPLLARYSNKYGVCLIHRHCTLEEGEKMVAAGHVSQPERDVECHPLRWLASGEPFEFTKEPTEPPPPELLESFKQLVGSQSGLGLFYVHEQDRGGGVVLAERTEGRKNILKVTLHPDKDPDAIVTGWINGPEGLTTFFTCPGDSH